MKRTPCPKCQGEALERGDGKAFCGFCGWNNLVVTPPLPGPRALRLFGAEPPMTEEEKTAAAAKEAARVGTLKQAAKERGDRWTGR